MVTSRKAGESHGVKRLKRTMKAPKSRSAKLAEGLAEVRKRVDNVLTTLTYRWEDSDNPLSGLTDPRATTMGAHATISLFSESNIAGAMTNMPFWDEEQTGAGDHWTTRTIDRDNGTAQFRNFDFDMRYASAGSTIKNTSDYDQEVRFYICQVKDTQTSMAQFLTSINEGANDAYKGTTPNAGNPLFYPSDIPWWKSKVKVAGTHKCVLHPGESYDIKAPQQWLKPQDIPVQESASGESWNKFKEIFVYLQIIGRPWWDDSAKRYIRRTPVSGDFQVYRHGTIKLVYNAGGPGGRFYRVDNGTLILGTSAGKGVVFHPDDKAATSVAQPA